MNEPMTNTDRIISSIIAQNVMQEQIKSGNRIIINITTVGKNTNHSFVDLALGKISDREYIIDRWHGSQESNYHYYAGMESNPTQYNNGAETIRQINETEAMFSLYPTGTIVVLTTYVAQKAVVNVMPIAQFLSI